MKCYIVAVGEQTNYPGYDYEYHVFMTEEKAEAYFDKAVAEKLAQYDYSEDELEEMRENSTYTSYFGIEDEWVVRIDEGVLGD